MQPQDSSLSCKPQHPHLSTKEGNFAHAGMSALSTVHPYHCSAHSGLSCGRPLPRPSSSARHGGGVPARRGHTPPAGPAAWGAHRGQAEVTGCQEWSPALQPQCPEPLCSPFLSGSDRQTGSPSCWSKTCPCSNALSSCLTKTCSAIILFKRQRQQQLQRLCFSYRTPQAGQYRWE